MILSCAGLPSVHFRNAQFHAYLGPISRLCFLSLAQFSLLPWLATARPESYLDVILQLPRPRSLQSRAHDPLLFMATLLVVLWLPCLPLVSPVPRTVSVPLVGCTRHCHTREHIVEKVLIAFSRCLGGANRCPEQMPFLPSPLISSTQTPW